MSKERRKHRASFKAKEALEAIKGEETAGEMAARYEGPSRPDTGLEKALLEEASGIFTGVFNGNHGKGQKSD